MSNAGGGFGGPGFGNAGGGGFGRDGGGSGPRGVFISHATDDAPLAQAFSELIHDASAGMLPTYASSSKDPSNGIPYGDDWFNWIEGKIKESGNVVALITPTSVGRPWILFEAGFGRAIEGVKVFGLRLGTTGEDAYVGPFKAFQNSGSEPDDLLKLCRQLFEGTACNPREEALKTFITQFLEKVEAHFAKAHSQTKKEDPQSSAVFRALEEMKTLVQTRPVVRAEEFEEMRMMKADDLMRSVRHFGREELDPALRATMLLGIAQEVGMGWIAPSIQYALGHSVNTDRLFRLVMKTGMGMRSYRRMPFPPEMLLEELFSAVNEYQDRRFRRGRSSTVEQGLQQEEKEP